MRPFLHSLSFTWNRKLLRAYLLPSCGRNMKKPQNGSCSNEAIKCQSSRKSRNTYNSSCDNNKNKRSFFEFSLSLLVSFWFLFLLFYSKLGLSHDNSGAFFYFLLVLINYFYLFLPILCFVWNFLATHFPLSRRCFSNFLFDWWKT